VNKKRILKSFLLLLILFICFLPILVDSSASFRAVVTGSSVNIRSGAGTNFTLLTTVSQNTQLNMVSSNPTVTPGTGCTGGWHHVFLPNSTTQRGFICANFIRVEPGVAIVVPDTFGRPWLTPGQSIIGGAEFVAQRYIGRGQFTTYLKKFNVNPASPSYPHGHQYMTNIRAPRSEARISHSSYSQSGMLSRALVFTIPVFNSMLSVTNVGTEIRTNTGTCSNRNKTFEDALLAQGFPQSYVNYLGCLHLQRPNWRFEILRTNLSWNSSVTAQQRAGAIDTTASGYRTSPAELVEGNNWWRPSTAATAFFLDPRNFLDERHILMFERLAFSSTKREADVQFVLNNTFMSGRSALDNNQTFASLFMQAGRTHNVNPVYLASLSRQEVGSQGSFAVRGEMFTYEGVTYQGLYNFYNIGASSGSTNPVLRGLRWASGTSTIPIVTGTIAGDLHVRGYRISNNNITGLRLGLTPATLRSQLPNHTVTVVNSAGERISNNGRIGTGSRITITNEEETRTLTVIIYGDITGTGRIDSGDLLAMRQHLLGTRTLRGVYATAADINKDGRVNSGDLLALRQHLLGTRTIKQ